MGFIEDSNATDQNDNTIVVGTGTPGSPIGGVVTVQGDPSGTDIPVKDIADVAGVNGSVVVGLTAVPARVGAANLAARKNLTIFNNSNTDLFWGYSSSVTTANGTPIFKNQLLSLDVGPNITIYLIANSASNNARITEVS